jgi:hypothetical protein
MRPAPSNFAPDMAVAASLLTIPLVIKLRGQASQDANIAPFHGRPPAKRRSVHWLS